MKKIFFILLMGLMLGFCQTKTEEIPSLEKSLLPYYKGYTSTFVSPDQDTVYIECIQAEWGAYRSPGVGCVHKKNVTFYCQFQSSNKSFFNPGTIYVSKETGNWLFEMSVSSVNKLSDMTFYDKIKISDQFFSNVYEAKLNSYRPNSLDSLSSTYFNTDGIVGFITNNGKKIFKKI